MKGGLGFSKSVAELLALALVLEASGYPKPGNVHRTSDKAGLRYEAFLATSIFAVKYFERGVKRGQRGFKRLVLGDLVYGLVNEAMEKLNSTNTCLGTALLLSLMSVSLGVHSTRGSLDVEELGSVSKEVLNNTTTWDTIYYYRAIRKAAPSYIKPSDETGPYVNVWDPMYAARILEKGHRLVEVLKYSARFDIVAREALSGFQQGFLAERFMRERVSIHGDLNRAIVETYLYLLSNNIDTIVYLKHGPNVAKEVSESASRILRKLLSLGKDWREVALKLDREFSSRGINPGAVADLTAETIALYMLRNFAKGSLILDLSR